uniref:Uncharacterized protein n=1 Tax=Falco tinnunculus TaxID=100819 RepID=A0A8C4XK62_FALTI
MPPSSPCVSSPGWGSGAAGVAALGVPGDGVGLCRVGGLRACPTGWAEQGARFEAVPGAALWLPAVPLPSPGETPLLLGGCWSSGRVGRV